ncbi:MAG: anti-sigma F factor [Clostridia bacterium]|nr:anti-sigma F factor [Clostridia bacterium]
MKKPKNEVKITFHSRSVNERLARSIVAAFAAQADPSVSVLADLRTAVSEAVTNAIVHAYPDEMGKITMTLKLYDDGRLTVKIADRGCGIPDVAEAMTPLFTTGGEERSGLGFSVMESFCDKVKVRSKVGKGTAVTLYKTLTEKGGESR